LELPQAGCGDPVEKYMVRPVWQEARLKPHGLEPYMTSDDPVFERKAADVIELFLNAQQHAASFVSMNGQRFAIALFAVNTPMSVWRCTSLWDRAKDGSIAGGSACPTTMLGLL
jgi:hypothetical protein